jgi:heme/copper-type cytochrome/quinol oxidase subunit 3
MADGGATDEGGATESAGMRCGSLSGAIGRYFFYGWLFRDASAGSDLERAAALRHNRNLSKWLPTYLRRWLVIGSVTVILATWSERNLDNALLSAVLAVALVLIVVFLIVTLLCWTLLSMDRAPPRRPR